jgi:hypothetical protein
MVISSAQTVLRRRAYQTRALCLTRNLRQAPLIPLLIIALVTRMMKLGIGEGRSAQGMSDPPSQLIGQEHQDVMG